MKHLKLAFIIVLPFLTPSMAQAQQCARSDISSTALDTIGRDREGTVHLACGRWDAAIASFEKALAVSPDDARSYIGLSVAYINLNKPDSSFVAAEKAVTLMPDMFLAHAFLGWGYLHKEMYEKAEESFKKAIRLKPDYSWPYIGLGSTYLHMCKFDDAIIFLEEALRLEPDRDGAHLYLAIAYKNLGNKIRAANHYYKAGELFLQRGDQKMARLSYEGLREIDPNLAGNLLNKLRAD